MPCRLPRLAVAALAAFGLAAATTAQTADKRIVGYFPSWGIYARNYHVPNIPAAQLTHINYAFANVQNGVVTLGDSYADIDRWYQGDCWNPGCRRGSFERLRVLKQQFPHLKTLISVGGWTWSSGFSDAVLTPASRGTFAQSIVDFVDLHEFDGADIDWEYPVSGGLAGNTTRPQDRQNYTAFLLELRARFNTRAQTTGKQYLLTIAAPANPAIIANFEVALIHPVLDWINLMTYDLRGPWGDPLTGFNAPLYADPQEPVAEPVRSQWNAAATVANYRNLGVPPTKLHLGMAFYGRGFGNVQSTTNGLYAAYNGPSWPGTWENGVYDYTDLAAHYENTAGWQKHWHPTTRVPWLWNATSHTFIGYDDPRSIAEKAAFVQQHGLGGAMFWELSGDRNTALLGPLDLWLRQRSALTASADRVSLQNPTRIDLQVRGGTARAGRSYLVLTSLSGTFPGLPLQGGLLPLNYDFLMQASAQLTGTALFPNGFGQLDAQGTANAALAFPAAAPLPGALLGMSVHACTWLFPAAGAPTGEPSNPVEIRFVP